MIRFRNYHFFIHFGIISNSFENSFFRNEKKRIILYDTIKRDHFQLEKYENQINYKLKII